MINGDLEFLIHSSEQRETNCLLTRRCLLKHKEDFYSWDLDRFLKGKHFRDFYRYVEVIFLSNKGPYVKSIYRKQWIDIWLGEAGEQQRFRPWIRKLHGRPGDESLSKTHSVSQTFGREAPDGEEDYENSGIFLPEDLADSPVNWSFETSRIVSNQDDADPFSNIEIIQLLSVVETLVKDLPVPEAPPAPQKGLHKTKSHNKLSFASFREKPRIEPVGIEPTEVIIEGREPSSEAIRTVERFQSPKVVEVTRTKKSVCRPGAKPTETENCNGHRGIKVLRSCSLAALSRLQSARKNTEKPSCSRERLRAKAPFLQRVFLPALHSIQKAQHEDFRFPSEPMKTVQRPPPGLKDCLARLNSVLFTGKIGLVSHPELPTRPLRAGSVQRVFDMRKSASNAGGSDRF